MAFKATLEVTCWKEHTCSYCESKYRYPLTRSQTIQANTKEKAEQGVLQRIQTTIENEVDAWPCPQCGQLQPDMIASQQSRWAWRGAIVMLVLFAVAVGFAIAGGAAQDSTWLFILTALTFVVAAVSLTLAGRTPATARPTSSLKSPAGTELVAKGQAVGDPSVKPIPTGAAGVVILVACAVMMLADGARLALGWPTNPNWNPHIAGPGDSPWIRFRNMEVDAVKGIWTAASQEAMVVNAQEVGLAEPSLKTFSRQESWGNNISVSSKESKRSSITPWCQIRVPNQPSLAGKTLKVRMRLTIAYPQLVGNTFQNAGGVVEHEADLVLAAPHAGGTYLMLWTAGALTGIAVIALLFFLLTRRAKGNRELAAPTRVYPLKST
jgi:hypothetical protein